MTGLARFHGRTVAIIGQQKGRELNERTRRNFGMAHPEGYRKGMRVMEIAQRHGFPLVTFLDSPGAYPGVAAEQHGQGGAIARSQALMARLTVPLVACIIGEGNSGGAIAIGLVDRVLMQENAIYSVISPEGLRRDPLARRRREGQGRCRAQARRGALPRARGDRRDRRRAEGWRAPESRRGRPHARGRAHEDPGRADRDPGEPSFASSAASDTAAPGIFSARSQEPALQPGS